VPRWCLLIHQLPPKPLYLRARIRQHLARVGAVALKNSVYVLPHSEASIEAFQAIAEEAVAGGGEAFLCAADFLGRPPDAEVEERFRRERRSAYEEICGQARKLLRQARFLGADGAAEADLSSRTHRLKRRLEEVIALDFFGAPERAAAEALLDELDAAHEQANEAPRPAEPHAGRQRFPELVDRTWVTRRGVHVDRIASAWLIRRFVDPAARFRFADSQSPGVGAGELRFDTEGGEFTHEGDRCTFETLAVRLGLADPALTQIAEIVHDIDIKDGKYGRPEVPGILQLVNGLAFAHPADLDRLDRGFSLFDDLYASFRQRLPQSAAATASARSPASHVRQGASKLRRQSK